ncbi:MAG: 2-dehydro-3-deoxygalactonokinase [Deltaproteobacteria bacterium]
MIAIDWGTTNVRAYLVDEKGVIGARRSAPFGVMAARGSELIATLDALVEGWPESESGPIMMCGMVGSRQGLLEVPYVRCPATEADIARGVREIDLGRGRSALICPGLICEDASGVPDVLRGEETQAIGALADLPLGTVSLWLPGTHSKHVRVRDGVIDGFSTHMTGEVFSTLSQHSILERLMTESALDGEAFDEGVRRAANPGGLLHHIFGVRSRALAGGLASSATRGYLSGILIGHEILSDEPAEGGPVYVLDDGLLGELYLRALALVGIAARQAGPDLAATGLLRLRRTIEKDVVP